MNDSLPLHDTNALSLHHTILEPQALTMVINQTGKHRMRSLGETESGIPIGNFSIYAEAISSAALLK